MNMFVSTAALAAGSNAAISQPQDDSRLLDLDEKIFEHHAAATAYDDEIFRLWHILSAEAKWLHYKSPTGRCTLTPKEQWDLVREMPESKEYTRLVNLQDSHYEEMDKLIKEMWATPAHTSEGRRAKFFVLLNCILTDDWREHDGKASYETRRARDLMIEFVGGETAEQLRDQFAA